MMKIRIFLLSLFCMLMSSYLKAQDVAVKTNLIYDALLTADLGVEVGVAPKWTVELTGNLNAWTINDRRWKQWNFQPEARYWFCQSFAGHFVGAHLIGGQYNFGHLPFGFKFLGTDFSKLKDYRYQGWMVGAGVAYGYTWLLNRRWSMEAEIGIGWIYTRYDQFECRDCGQRIARNRAHNYVGPTKAALNLIYNF